MFLRRRRIDRSSIAVENEVKEINAIGKTFSYLLELIAERKYSTLINPLQRLLPVVQTSTF